MNIDDIAIRRETQPVTMAQRPKDDVAVHDQHKCEAAGQNQAVPDLHRKSIFADQSGILIAQVKDQHGDIIASYPSREAISRYLSCKG